VEIMPFLRALYFCNVRDTHVWKLSTLMILFVSSVGLDWLCCSGVGMPDIGRMMGQLWRVLPDDQKEVGIFVCT